MPSITIKDLPAELHEDLKREAETNGRSLSRHILLKLRLSTPRAPRDVEATLKRLRAFRNGFKGRPMTTAEVIRAIGRDRH